MTAIEVVVLLLNVPVLVYCLLGRQLPVWARLLPAVAVAVIAVQYTVTAQRWQMWPAYVVAAWLLVACAWPRGIGAGFWTGIFGLAGLVAAAAMGTVLPIFEFPTPTGAFPIGTVTLHLVDHHREETQGSHPGGYRELMVQIWYPAHCSGPKLRYRTPSETSFKRSRLTLVTTHASASVPLADALARYPLLIYSPGWTGCRDHNTSQAEELASHGFVVVGVDHPYGSELTIFPDGRRIASVLGDWMDFSSDEAFQSALSTFEEQLRIRTADARFVVDELERLDRDDPAGLLTGRLDLARIGIFGFSFGGAVAAETCRMDRRFAAGIDLDGVIAGESAKEGIEQPFMFMSSGSAPPAGTDLQSSTSPKGRRLAFLNECERNVRRSLSTHGGYFVFIRESRHMNFSDGPLASPLKWRTEGGPISPRRAVRIINDYTLAFFNRFLNGQIEPLLESPSSFYPEVEFESWPRPTMAADRDES